MDVSQNAVAEDSFWTPDQRFSGATVFCLASGPSLSVEICGKVKGLPTIVVNSSCTLAPWADVLYFTDNGWYETHKGIVENWPGLVVAMARRAKRELPHKVHLVKGAGDPTLNHISTFPPLGSPFIRQGRSSGHTAIALAVAMGAKRVVMLGYDMKPAADGQEHHHTEYQDRDLAKYARDFVPAFSGWNAAAIKAGVEIINCTADSAVTEFPFADLEEVLACARS